MIGQTLDGKYKIEKQLGKGGMGTVFLATHIGTERPVAVKVIASEFMQRAEFVERFRREARAAGRLRHPNVVDVTDFGFSETRDGEAAYLVMEYLDGCTLGEILEEEKLLPLSWTVDILEQVCSAVHEAHQQGIIHRDLKPDNIWLEPNQRGGYTVKVLDFGIAKLEEHQDLMDDQPEPLPEASVDPEPAAADDKRTRPFLGSSNPALSERKTVVQNGEEGEPTGRETVAVDLKSADQTVASEAKTIASEAGTIIQLTESSAEGEAGILPDGETKIMSSEEDAATKLISDGGDTDKSEKAQLTKGKSLLDSKSTAELTRVGAVLGTPLYMSPEQCRGEKLTQSSDIYSLGVIAYQMLSGKTPFDGNYTEVMESHKTVEPPPLEAKKIRKRVKKVIQSTMAKNPEERPQTAEALASELRSSSEGLGTLLQRAMVIYSQRIQKFLQIAFLLAIPSIILTIIGVALRFLAAADVLGDGLLVGIISGILGLITFFVQISYAALLVGMTTWIVAQVLAAPLRPISVKAAFGQVKQRIKPLLKTVTVSTLLSMLGTLFCLLPGIFLSSRYMLIAPSIMMEGISGRTAFKRSIELGKRSYRTVFATAVLVYAVPIFLALTIGLAVGGILNAFDPKPPAEKPAATENVKDENAAENNEKAEKPKEKGRRGGFSFGKGFSITTDDGSEDKEKTMAGNLRVALRQGIFELLWSPIVILLSSFTSVLTALLYFKTRQAGGESMQGLLHQFEEAECSTSKWRNRVRQRLLQSGRTTGGRRFTGG